MKSAKNLVAVLAWIPASALATVEHVAWDCGPRDAHDDGSIESVQVIERDLGSAPQYVVSVVFDVGYDNHEVAEVDAKQVSPLPGRMGGATVYHGKDLLLTLRTDSKPMNGDIAATLSLKRGTYNAELLCTRR